MKLAIGPLLYFWPREAVLAFYRELCELPVDIVYLGEVVCAKRRALRRDDWLALAADLRACGKEAVLSTLALIEAESELSSLARTVATPDVVVEANDMAAVELLRGHAFVAGPHLNVYNAATLALLAAWGARRWVAPVELDVATLGEILAQRPAGLEAEVLAFGRLPLAFSARCFTARAFDRAKDDCAFVCAEHADGLTVRTREGEPLFALNGIQTQSARVHNALRSVPSYAAAGGDVVRLSPHSAAAGSFAEVVWAFRTALDARGSVGTAPACPPTALPGGYCDGYVHAAAGMRRGREDG
jgi:collagenase-like PrtC family protease